MRVCYFIQTHKNPKQIYRLVRTIKTSSPNALVVIGHNFTQSSLDMNPLQDLADVHLLRMDFEVLWGDYSLIQPYLKAVNWLINNNFDFDWLVYLSGQDYPTQPLSEIEHFLATTEYDAFFDYAEAMSPEGYAIVKNPDQRYFYQYYRPPVWLHPLLVIPYKIFLRFQQFTPITIWYIDGFPIGMKARHTPFNENFICYCSYQWNTLSRKCVEYINEFVHDERNQGMIEYYKRTIIPDESFVATILVNSKRFNIDKDNKRYIEFVGREAHPRILTEKDFPVLTNGKYHFARKFEQDSSILDRLDAYILPQVTTNVC